MKFERTPLPEWTRLPNAMDKLKWYQNTGNLKLWYFISLLYVGDYLSGFDASAAGGLISFPYWKKDTGNPNAAQIGLMNAMGYITGILIGPICSWVCDRYGRRHPLRFYAITMVLGTLFGAIAGVPSIKGVSAWGMFILSKALMGAGLTCGQMTTMITLQEITHPRNRQAIAGFYDCNWILGNVSANWIVFGCTHIHSSWQWRVPYLLQLVPAFYVLIGMFLVPETPRFLLAKGNEKEALNFLVDYHGNGDANDEMVLYEFAEIKGTLEAETAQRQLSWREILSYGPHRHRVGLAGLMTFMPQLDGSQIITSYYSSMLKLVGITQATQQTGIAAGLSMFKFLMQCIGTWCLPRFNRRTLVLSAWPVMMVFLALLMACNAIYIESHNKNHSAGLAAIVFIWFFGGTHIFNTPLFYSYPAEILPFPLRAKGMGFWNFVNQATGIFSAYTNSVGLARITWKYYGVYLAILPCQWLLAYIYMVDTRGLTLEEVAIVFEGNSAGVAKVDAELEANYKADSDSDLKVEGKSSVVPVV